MSENKILLEFEKPDNDYEALELLKQIVEMFNNDVFEDTYITILQKAEEN